MRHPVPYTFLGFHFNSFIDNGDVLDLKETHKRIRDKAIFPWLKDKYGDRLDISLFSPEDLNSFEAFFESLSISTDENKKMGVKNNGLCLLLAYCLEGAQREANAMADYPITYITI